MIQATVPAQVRINTPLRATLAVIVGTCVVIQTLAEWAMLNQFRADVQLSIWWGSLVIKAIFWLFTGLIFAWLASVRRPSAGLALAFLAIWTVAISWVGVNYWQGRQALADAADPNTSRQRLTELAHFQGFKVAYELDNRLAANPTTTSTVLRELHRRKEQVGTQMKLAANPHTPEDILRELSMHEDVDVRRELAKNPAISQDIIEQLAKDIDPQVPREVGEQSIVVRRDDIALIDRARPKHVFRL